MSNMESVKNYIFHVCSDYPWKQFQMIALKSIGKLFVLPVGAWVFVLRCIMVHSCVAVDNIEITVHCEGSNALDQTSENPSNTRQRTRVLGQTWKTTQLCRVTNIFGSDVWLQIFEIHFHFLLRYLIQKKVNQLFVTVGEL